MIVRSHETDTAAEGPDETGQPEPVGGAGDRAGPHRAHPYLAPEDYRTFADDFDWGLV
ncbi:hypothetical protein [Subtercola sp. RTI3]|uniref:hypothetical protein n=1 Tax=Subtercola sp. RTI3 TaxID=3048639 RepID=UPI00269C22FF|nr:hypothetical protein [Subtercola sp. RTI3]MEA9986818.1 hypothetical protein [Subtercola sp. RTI3]